jgi:hypothetical protein
VRRTILLAALLAVPVVAGAQSSQFGIRGLGIPTRPISARAAGTGGSFALFEAESGTNPAAITGAPALQATFNVLPNTRTSSNPAGEGSARTVRFPYVAIMNRIKNTNIYISAGAGTYTDRDYSVTSSDTTIIDGQPVGYDDKLTSKGGVADIRLAAGYRPSAKWAVGLGLHFITGSSRMELRRDFSDSTLSEVFQRSEISYDAIGISAGSLYRLTPKLLLAGMFRVDGRADVDQDSSDAFKVDLPWSVTAGAQYTLSRRATLAVMGEYTSWSVAHDDLLAVGGVGAEDTWRAAAGAELVTSEATPTKFPLRLGVRAGTLPFPLAPGVQATEFGASAGTGLRIAKGRGSLDVSLERVWRSDDADFSESAWLLGFAVTVRP